MLVAVHGFSRECLGTVVARRLGPDNVLAVPAELFVERDPPGYIRSDTARS